MPDSRWLLEDAMKTVPELLSSVALFTKSPATVKEPDGKVTSPEVESMVKAPVVKAGLAPKVLVPAPEKVIFSKVLVPVKVPERV